MRAALGGQRDIGGAEDTGLGGGGGNRGRSLQFIDGFDHQEDHQTDNQEIDQGVDEQAVIQRWSAKFFGFGQGLIGVAVEGNEQIGEIDISEQQPNGRHDDVIDE